MTLASEADDDKEAEFPVSRTLKSWSAFVAFTLYVLVTIGALTHEQMLDGEKLRLPILSVDLPIVGFSLFAATILVGLHIHVLTQFSLIGDQVLSFSLLPRPISNPIVSIFIGGRSKSNLINYMYGFVPIITLLAMPPLTIIFILVTELPLHNIPVTIAYKILLLIDVAMIIIIVGRWGPIKVIATFGCILSYAFFLLSFTFPGELPDAITVPALTHLLDRKYGAAGRERQFFGNYMVITERRGSDGRSPKPLILRDRDLRGAVFDDSDLTGSDFRGSALVGASFQRANVSQARFDRPDQPNAPDDANLSGINLAEAILAGTKFDRAIMDGAFLDGAQLNNTSFSSADIRAASFRFTEVTKSDFKNTDLTGASFSGARFDGPSDFSQAEMEGASLLEVSDTSFRDSFDLDRALKKLTDPKTALQETYLVLVCRDRILAQGLIQNHNLQHLGETTGFPEFLKLMRAQRICPGVSGLSDADFRKNGWRPDLLR